MVPPIDCLALWNSVCRIHRKWYSTGTCRQSIVFYLISDFRLMNSALCHLLSVVCPLFSVFWSLTSDLWILPSVICYLSSALCYLSSALCFLFSDLRLPAYEFFPLSSVICRLPSVFCLLISDLWPFASFAPWLALFNSSKKTSGANLTGAVQKKSFKLCTFCINVSYFVMPKKLCMVHSIMCNFIFYLLPNIFLSYPLNPLFKNISYMKN